MDEVAENSDALMERYLEGEEISHEEIVAALKDGTNHGDLFPVTCGVATRNLGDEPAARRDRRGPALAGQARRARAPRDHARAADEDAPLFAYVFKTRADPFAGRINLFRVYQGTMAHDTHVLNTRAHAKERIGQLLTFSGRETEQADEFGPGDIGAVAKLKETRAGDWLADARRADRDAGDQAAGAGHGVRARGQVARRRGQGLHRAAPPAGGGPDDRPAPRRADRRADRRRPLADPRRGRRRADEVALRRRGHAEAAAGALPARRSAARPRPTAATRSSRAGAASSATATSRSSRSATATASSSSTRSRAA